jgi:hypothetical protein
VLAALFPPPAPAAAAAPAAPVALAAWLPSHGLPGTAEFFSTNGQRGRPAYAMRLAFSAPLSWKGLAFSMHAPLNDTHISKRIAPMASSPQTTSLGNRDQLGAVAGAP